jgi:hypothetical protein
MDSVVAAKLVMPGLVLGIHILARVERSHGREPGHDEKASHFQAIREGLEILAAFSVILCGR